MKYGLTKAALSDSLKIGLSSAQTLDAKT